MCDQHTFQCWRLCNFLFYPLLLFFTLFSTLQLPFYVSLSFFSSTHLFFTLPSHSFPPLFLPLSSASCPPASFLYCHPISPASTCLDFCYPSICLPHPPHRTGLMTQVCSPIREASQSGLWCWGTSSGKGLRLPTGWDPCVVMETVSNISLAGYCFTGRRCQSWHLSNVCLKASSGQTGEHGRRLFLP